MPKLHNVLLLLTLAGYVSAQEKCLGDDWLYDSSMNACLLPVLQNLTWSAAVANCQRYNSTLMPLRNQLANTVATTIVVYDAEREDWWTGGARADSNSQFHWLDGTALTFTKWLPMYPDKQVGSDCLAIHMINAIYGGWKNEDCKQKMPSICIIENAVPLPTEDTKDCPAGKYTDPSGSLNSPGWPSNYPDNADCYYQVQAQGNYRLNLTLDFFQTEKCCDWLYIHDGPNVQSPKLASLRGAVANGTSFLSSGNSLTLRFTSDESNNDKGFYAHYYTV
ncbi:unnamed protein product, partial [Mesorhabditis spiculigera]